MTHLHVLNAHTHTYSIHNSTEENDAFDENHTHHTKPIEWREKKNKTNSREKRK